VVAPGPAMTDLTPANPRERGRELLGSSPAKAQGARRRLGSTRVCPCTRRSGRDRDMTTDRLIRPIVNRPLWHVQPNHVGCYRTRDLERTTATVRSPA
jgi:hypothetical protein